MVRKFEEVNKSFNSFKPLLYKILAKASENSTMKNYKCITVLEARQLVSQFYEQF